MQLKLSHLTPALSCCFALYRQQNRSHSSLLKCLGFLGCRSETRQTRRVSAYYSLGTSLDSTSARSASCSTTRDSATCPQRHSLEMQTRSTASAVVATVQGRRQGWSQTGLSEDDSCSFRLMSSWALLLNDSCSRLVGGSSLPRCMCECLSAE